MGCFFDFFPCQEVEMKEDDLVNYRGHHHFRSQAFIKTSGRHDHHDRNNIFEHFRSRYYYKSTRQLEEI